MAQGEHATHVFCHRDRLQANTNPFKVSYLCVLVQQLMNMTASGHSYGSKSDVALSPVQETCTGWRLRLRYD